MSQLLTPSFIFLPRYHYPGNEFDDTLPWLLWWQHIVDHIFRYYFLDIKIHASFQPLAIRDIALKNGIFGIVWAGAAQRAPPYQSTSGNSWNNRDPLGIGLGERTPYRGFGCAIVWHHLLTFWSICHFLHYPIRLAICPLVLPLRPVYRFLDIYLSYPPVLEPEVVYRKQLRPRRVKSFGSHTS